MGDDQDALGGNPVAVPQVENVVAQGFAGQDVQRRECFIHQQHVRVRHQGARNADALAHAAGEFARQRATKPGKADQFQHRIGALFTLVGGDSLRLEPELDILLHRQPRKQRERLEHHCHAGGGPLHVPTAVDGSTGIGRNQTRHDAQQGRLAGAGLAQQRHDLALRQRKIDILQYEARSTVGALE